jgi:protein-tyrosine phosphatase
MAAIFIQTHKWRKIMVSMDWITKNIAIGNVHSARNLNGQFDVVLCLTGCCRDVDDEDDVYREVIPLNDGPGNSFEKIELAVKFIQEAVEADEQILVHCNAGHSRSTSIVALWMMMHLGMTKGDAFKAISLKRTVFLSPGIEEIFNVLY